SALYIKSVYSFEDFFFKKLNVSDYIRHAAGMLAMGLMMFLMMRITGKYYIQGVGYATIQDVLSGNLDLAGFLLLLAGLKLLSVCFTLGSGASGGIFSPGLYIGATIGGAFAIIFQHLFPGLSISVVAFVLAGMAGVIAGTTGAAMASIVIIFEMTLDYNIIIPVTLTVALSYVIRKILVDKSMFTMQVSRHGRYMPEALQANYHHEIFAKDIVDDQYREIPGHLSLEDFSEILTKNRDTPWFIRTNEQNRIDGVVSRDRALIWTSEYDQTTLVKDLPFYSFEKVSPHSKLFQVTKLIGRCSSHLVLVIKDTMDKSSKSKSEIENVVGIITRTNVARVMERAMNMFSE
ncbi:MAG TPA: chloride channel protein, partial [Balneolaceae bacterium]|nr:chloride channel protein [Balneolaceae bacterium]